MKSLVNRRRFGQLRKSGSRPHLEALEDRTLPSFLSALSSPAGGQPTWMITADVNGDHIPDIITANSYNSIGIALGNGDGTFGPVKGYAVGTQPDGLAVGDFNGDGKLDLAVADFGSNQVSILLGNGNGTFQTHVDYSCGGGPTCVVVGDFNKDGYLDVASSNDGGNNVTILFGIGDGTFLAGVAPRPGGTSRYTLRPPPPLGAWLSYSIRILLLEVVLLP